MSKVSSASVYQLQDKHPQTYLRTDTLRTHREKRSVKGAGFVVIRKGVAALYNKLGAEEGICRILNSVKLPFDGVVISSI